MFFVLKEGSEEIIAITPIQNVAEDVATLQNFNCIIRFSAEFGKCQF